MQDHKMFGASSAASLRWLNGAAQDATADAAPRRPARRNAPSCESLEGRVVLSNWGGGDLLGGLAQIGVVTAVMDLGGARVGQDSQTDADWKALQTEIQTLTAKSDVTIADLSALASDSKAIATGGGLKVDGLKTVLDSLAAAVAGGGDTTQAQSDFKALFSGSNVDQATIGKTFTDLVQTIKDSNITTSDLSDFSELTASLPQPGGPTNGNGPGFPGGPGGIGHNGPRGDALTASLADAGVMAPLTGLQTPDSPGTAPGTSATGTAKGSQSSQLQSDFDQLRTDQQNVSAKSSVSSSQLEQLKTDSQDIVAAGLHFDSKTLQTTINGLVTAVAGGGDTTQSQSDFKALFSGSNVDQATIDKTFTDLVQTIKDSNITAADVSLIAKDHAAVQADLDALPRNGMPGHGQGGGKPGGPGGMFGGSGGMNDQGGNAAHSDFDRVAGLSGDAGATASDGGASATPAVSGNSVSDQAGDANHEATSTATPFAVQSTMGGRFRGSARGQFHRTLGSGTARNANGGPEYSGITGRTAGMHQQGRGGAMNRARRR